jgi:uncharacterized membrane protein YsdA (DUF1294 family)
MFAGVVCYLLAMNLWAFAAFWADKRAARLGEWRTPERTLLMLALIGGTSGAIAAQQLLRHKTRKEPFRSILWSIAGAQALLLVWLYVRALAAR